AKALDWAGNSSVVYSTVVFTYDITAPTVQINTPLNNGYYSAIKPSTFSGQAFNSQSEAYTGPSTVTLAITDITDGGNFYCYYGSSFSACAASVWLPGQGSTASWHYDIPVSSFTSDHKYKYEADVYDLAGNHPAVPAAVEMKYDLDIPTSTITSPSAEYVNSLPSISGQASDDLSNNKTYEAGLGTYTVKAALQLVGGKWWDGAGFTGDDPSWYETSVNTGPYSVGGFILDWTWDMTAVGKVGELQSVINSLGTRDYLAVSWSYDLAENRQYGAGVQPTGAEVAAAGAGRIIRFDNQKPVALATAPVPGAYINTPNNVFYGTVSDAGEVDRVHVMVKARGVFNAYWKGTYLGTFGDDWDTGADKYTHWSTATYAAGGWSILLSSLTPVNNSKISVWVRAGDKAGNWMDTPSDVQLDGNLNADGSSAFYFTFDESIPQTTVTSPDVYAMSHSTDLIKGLATETGNEPSGIGNVKVRLGRSGGAYWRFYEADWAGGSGFYDKDTFSAPDWTKSVTASSQEDGWQYHIHQYAIDRAQNNASGAYFSTFTFIVDKTTPTSVIGFPADDSFIGAVSAITGSADDSVENLRGYGESYRTYESGISTSVAAVEVALRDRGALCGGVPVVNECWWNDTAWADSASIIWSTAVFVGASSGTWSYSLPAGTILDGTTYYALSRVRDIAGYIQTQYTTNYFAGDTSTPTSRTTWPENNSTVYSVPDISGTAFDVSPGELKANAVVYISVKQETGPGAPLCYDPVGNSFISCVAGRIWFSTGTTTYNPDTAQPSTWTWNTGSVTWPNQSDFSVIARATDKAGNTKPDPGADDLRFRVETPQPYASIGSPAGPNDRNYRAVNISNITGSGTNLRPPTGTGTPADESIELRIKRLYGQERWWSFSTETWVEYDTFTWVGYTGSGGSGDWAQSLNGAAAFTVDNASYTISATAYNISNEDVTTSLRVVIDNTMPTGVIAVPAGQYFNSLPSVSGNATDPGNITQPSLQKDAGGNVYVRIRDMYSPTYYWHGSSFAVGAVNIETAYSPAETVSWSTATAVNSGLKDGQHYMVYLLPRDKAGNMPVEGTISSYELVFDTTVPAAYISTPVHHQVFRSLSELRGT
ncbi:MAG: hypothetical protein COT18_02520, partial [Elusimicrobia bacterium CG08_land_8_20_14_0_20_59_10]